MSDPARAEFATELHIIESNRRLFLARWAKHTADLPDHAPIVWPADYTRDEAEDALHVEFWRRLRAARPSETAQVRASLSLKLGQGRDQHDHTTHLAGLLVALLFGLGFLICFLFSR